MNIILGIGLFCVVLLWYGLRNSVKETKTLNDNRNTHFLSEIASIKNDMKKDDERDKAAAKDIVKILQQVCRHDGEFYFDVNYSSTQINLATLTATHGFDYGQKVCSICGKAVKTYTDEAEFDREKKQYDLEIKRAKTQAELEKATAMMKESTERLKKTVEAMTYDDGKTVATGIKRQDEPPKDTEIKTYTVGDFAIQENGIVRHKPDGWVVGKLEDLAQNTKRIVDLTELIAWMSGCGYDFNQHEYFRQKRDELFKTNG